MVGGRGSLAGAALSGAALLALSGCATAALDRYVGKDLTEVVSRYGPPTTHATLPTGAEAFRWVMSASRNTAARAPLDLFMPVAAAPLPQRERAASAGLLLGGMCVYTILARWNQGVRAWRVVGYEPPRADCD